MPHWERPRSILGLLAGAAMLASSAAHSLVGWTQLRSALEQARAPEELILTLGMGWNFGGAAMLAFGLIVVALFWRRLMGAPVSLMPAIIIGVAYLVFGAWAFLGSHFDPFFFVFVVPGVMLLIASFSRRAA